MLAPRAEGQTLAQLREAWMSACLAYNEQGAEQVLAEAFVMYPPEAVCLELLQESMAKIGERWYQGEVTVQQEHFCSALTIRRLEALVMASPPPIRPGRILAACPAGEEHVFGLLLLTFLLRRRGWEVIYLGASVPVDRLQTTVSAIQPQLAVLAVQQLHTVPGVIEMAEVLEREEVIMTYGGLVFNLLPDLLSRISGHFLGEDVELAVQTVEALMKAPRAASKAQPVSKEYLELRDLFVEHQNLIEAQLHRYLDGVAIAPRHIHTANRELAQNIEAALALGDIRYVGADIEWVEGLLGHHQVPMENLDRYLTAYYQAVEAELGERGGLILDWLGGLIAEGELHRRERA
jgi:methanogenic corrinoid protein MtbC1